MSNLTVTTLRVLLKMKKLCLVNIPDWLRSLLNKLDENRDLSLSFIYGCAFS